MSMLVQIDLPLWNHFKVGNDSSGQNDNKS